MLQNVSLDTEATVVNAEQVTVNAKDVICQNKEKIFASLEAAKAMVKNPIAKLCVNAVVNLIEHIIETTCADSVEAPAQPEA